ncbi:hypothetical protein PILCRDRAFT_811956 [Piloderma croceum F 1598]|uniref:Uncharacterized protein n=1 Tax=Piloderma croceum (strain F 1598) TaxID=765440 RepID=A0A0C3GHX6_PILCF|nr:hypothetical protein PILCRDRAFT_811956 [Piloderma croceum F 1598]
MAATNRIEVENMSVLHRKMDEGPCRVCSKVENGLIICHSRRHRLYSEYVAAIKDSSSR